MQLILVPNINTAQISDLYFAKKKKIFYGIKFGGRIRPHGPHKFNVIGSKWTIIEGIDIV